MPRDIEEQVNELDDAYLYTVDDLQNIISENIKNREQAAQQARVIIQQQSEDFGHWLKSLNSVGLIREYRSHAQQLAQQQLQKAQQLLAQGKPVDEVLQVLTHRLTQQLTHQPTQLLKVAGENHDQNALALLQQLLPTATNKDDKEK